MEDTSYEERKTPGGFLVKVRLAKMTYVVFTDNGPEVPRGAKNNSIVVNVPKVAFLGDDFHLTHFRLGELSFVNVKSGKLVIPYQHSSSNEIKTIFLNTGSNSDILPVLIHHFPKKEGLIAAYDKGESFHHLVIDEDIPRSDMVSLKIRYPMMNILVIKKKLGIAQEKKEEPTKDSKVVDVNKVRAADLANSGTNIPQNPVFLARIHLRNLELDKIKNLVIEHNLTSQDIAFIRTFLDVMIKNEYEKEELRLYHDRLKDLNEALRLVILILDFRVEELEVELAKGFMKRPIALTLIPVLARIQDSVKDTDKEIIVWEWKLIARRLAMKSQTAA
jgi:hypothetical protein